MAGSVRLSLAGLIVVSAASVGTGAASPEPVVPTSFVDAGLSAAFAELAPVDGGDDFQPASDPSVPDEGTPNPILRASAVTFNLGRAPEAADLVVNPNLGIDVLNGGSADYGANQQTATVVMVETDRPPTEGGNEVDNLSLAYSYPGQAVLEQSPFVNDPLLGFGTVLDRGAAQGQEFSSFQQIVDGQWQRFGDPIPTFGFTIEGPAQGFAPGGSTRYVTASVLFGPAARIAWISSHAGSAVAEALYFAIVGLEPPTVFLDPNDVATMEPLTTSIVTGPVCEPGEVLADGRCVPECDEGSVLDGGVCVPITCGEGEVAEGGLCVPITCGEGEVAEGGLCVPTDEVFPPLVCDQLGGALAPGGCGVTGLAEQPCGDGGGVPTGNVCLFADPPDETECDQLGSDFEWGDSGCSFLVTDVAAPASDVATDTGDGAVAAGQAPAAGGGADPAESGPWLLIVGGFVLVVIVAGGTWWFFWSRRGEGPNDVPLTTDEDSTEGPLASPSDDTQVPLLAAYLQSEAAQLGGLPPGSPLSEINSLITRAEALDLPNLDGWQLLEFDMAFHVLTQDEGLGPGSRWHQLAPPEAPIDGNQTGIWLDPVEGFRIGTPDDPHAFITPPEHELPPKPAPDMGEVVMAGEPSLDLDLSLVYDVEDSAPTSDGDDGAPWWGDGAPPVGPRESFVSAASQVEDGGEGPQQATIALLQYGETGTEADKLGRLEDIIRRFRGTGDIAGAAEALYEFNEWHTTRFDEPWFEWTNDTTDDTLSMAVGIDDFFMARKMSCFEFVHFCAYLASDQPARPRVDEAGNQIGQIWAWGLHERVFLAALAVPGGTEVPRGQAVTGVAKWLTGVNKAGYTHIVVSLGDGQVIGLGTDGLEKETVDECFNPWAYEGVEHGPYRYGGMNAAPTAGGE